MKKKNIVILIIIVGLLLIIGGLLIFKNLRHGNGYKLGKKDIIITNDNNIMPKKCIDTYCVDFVTAEYKGDKEKHYIVRTAVYNSSDSDLDEMNFKLTLKNKNNPIIIYKCLNHVVSNNHYSFEEIIPIDKKYKFNDYTVEKMSDEEVNTYCIKD